MPHRQPPPGKVFPDFGRELQEAEVVGDGGAVFSNLDCRFLLGQAEGFDELTVGLGGLDGVEIFPLNILDEGHLEGFGLSNVAHDYGDLREPGFPGGTPSALACDQFECVPTRGVDDDGLDDPPASDRVGEFPDAVAVEILPGLAAAGNDLVDVKLPDRLSVRGLRFGYEGLQPPPQSFSAHWQEPPLRRKNRPPLPWNGYRRG